MYDADLGIERTLVMMWARDDAWRRARTLRRASGGRCLPPPRGSGSGMASESAGGQRSGLIGRERDLVSIERRLASSRLVTIVGLGGIGKTTVARAIANRRAEQGG